MTVSSSARCAGMNTIQRVECLSSIPLSFSLTGSEASVQGRLHTYKLLLYKNVYSVRARARECFYPVLLCPVSFGGCLWVIYTVPANFYLVLLSPLFLFRYNSFQTEFFGVG